MRNKSWTLARRLQVLAGVAGIVVLALAGFLLSPWSPSRAHAAARYAAVAQRYHALRRQAGEIERLQHELKASRRQAREFLRASMPSRRLLYSTTVAELNRLAAERQVTLSNISFKPQRHSQAGLRGVEIGGSLTGPYAGLMRYLNAVERDPVFFQIRQVTLTRPQSRALGNVVRLHVVIATYERMQPQGGSPPDAAAGKGAGE